MRRTLVRMMLVLLMCGSVTHTFATPSQDSWQELEPLSSPGGLTHMTMAFHEGIEQPVIHSGRFENGTYSDKTWAFDYDGNTWKDLKPQISPPPRHAGDMVYHEPTDQLILYTGADANGYPINDLWAYNSDVNNWTQLFPERMPPANYFPIMVSVPSTNQILALISDTVTFSQMWIYNVAENNWTQSLAPNMPVFGDWDRSSLVYLDDLDKVLLFGTEAVWEYFIDSDSWIKLDTTNNPTNRKYTEMVFDSSIQKAVLFGGCDILRRTCDSDSEVFDDTWIFDYDTLAWTEIKSANSPPARYMDGNMVFDSERNRTLIYGSSDDSIYFDDTWVLDLSSYGQISSSSSATLSTTDSSEISTTSDANSPFIYSILAISVILLTNLTLISKIRSRRCER